MQDLVISIVASIVSITAFIPYAWNILRGSGRPKEASWLVFLWIDAVWLVPMFYNGSITPVTFLVCTWAIGNTVNFSLARWKGSDKKWSRVDKICFLAGIIAAVCGYVFSDQNIAIIGGIIAMFIGTVPTAYALIKDSTREPLVPWMLWFVGSSLSLYVAWDKWNISDTLLSASTLVQQLMLMIILFPHRARCMAHAIQSSGV